LRQKKKSNLVEENKGSSAKERIKYTLEMFEEDEKKREEIRMLLLTKLGNTVTEEILNFQQEPNIPDPIEELDLDKELQSVEDNWKLRELTSIDQRMKDVYSQPRK